MVLNYRGFPHINHNGHTYGIKKKYEKSILWKCTIAKNRIHCPATFYTVDVNGITMMKPGISYHTCHTKKFTVNVV